MPLKSGRLAGLRAEDGAPVASRLFHERVDAAPPETGARRSLDLDHRAYDAGFTEPGLRKTLGVAECSTASPQYHDPRVLTVLVDGEFWGGEGRIGGERSVRPCPF